MTDFNADWFLYIVMAGMVAFIAVLIMASIEDAMRSR